MRCFNINMNVCYYLCNSPSPYLSHIHVLSSFCKRHSFHSPNTLQTATNTRFFANKVPGVHAVFRPSCFVLLHTLPGDCVSPHTHTHIHTGLINMNLYATPHSAGWCNGFKSFRARRCLPRRLPAYFFSTIPSHLLRSFLADE